MFLAGGTPVCGAVHAADFERQPLRGAGCGRFQRSMLNIFRQPNICAVFRHEKKPRWLLLGVNLCPACGDPILLGDFRTQF